MAEFQGVLLAMERDFGIADQGESEGLQDESVVGVQ
jgi:hypothetical protein